MTEANRWRSTLKSKDRGIKINEAFLLGDEIVYETSSKRQGAILTSQLSTVQSDKPASSYYLKFQSAVIILMWNPHVIQ